MVESVCKYFFSYFIIRFLNHIFFLSLTLLISLSDFTIELLSKTLIGKINDKKK